MPMPRQRRTAVLLFAFVAATAADSPTDLYVSVAHGSDAAAGDSPAAAVRSLHRAAELVRAGTRSVHVDSGTYELSGTLNLSEARHANTAWVGASGGDGGVLVTGGRRLSSQPTDWRYDARTQSWALDLRPTARARMKAQAQPSKTTAAAGAGAAAAAVPSDATELYLNDARVLPLRSVVMGGMTPLPDGMGLVYDDPTALDGLDLSPRALRRWRVVINYSWTVGRHTVSAVDVTARTIHFEQRATAGGGAFFWLEGNIPELWPTNARAAAVLSGRWVNNDTAWGADDVDCVHDVATGSLTFTARDAARAHWTVATGNITACDATGDWCLVRLAFAPNPANVHDCLLADGNTTLTVHAIPSDPQGWSEVLSRAAQGSKLVPTGPTCTQTTPSGASCRPSALPWLLVEDDDAPGVAAELRLFSTDASRPPIGADDALVLALLPPPLIAVHGHNRSSTAPTQDPAGSDPLENISFSNMHFAHTRDPCPSSRSAPGSGSGSSQAWNNASIAPDVPRGSVNNPACDCLMIVGSIETGVKSLFTAAYTRGLRLDNVTASRAGGTGISIARSADARVSRCRLFELGANGAEFSRVSGAQLLNSIVGGYGLVMMGAAAVELDQSTALVEHNEFSGGVQNGLLNLDCHDGCEPSYIRKNHMHNAGTLNDYGLSDGGAIHVDHSTGYVEISGNVVHDIRAKGFNGGGLYIDDTTTNVNCTHNLFFNLKGGVIQWNKQAPGGIVNITNNVWAKSVNGTYAPVNSEEAFFQWDRDGAVNMSRNVIFYTPGVDGPLQQQPLSAYADVALDHNLYVDPTSWAGASGAFGGGNGSEAAQLFPGGATLAQWQAGGHDVHSAAAMHAGSDKAWTWEAFKIASHPQAQALGIEPLAIADCGPDWHRHH